MSPEAHRILSTAAEVVFWVICIGGAWVILDDILDAIFKRN